MSAPDVGALLTAWANRTPSIDALCLIGSRQRAASDSVWKQDVNSDWDFQVIARDPSLFATPAWLSEIPELKVKVYAPRGTRIGTVPKVNILFEGAEADIVVIPARAIKLGRLAVRLGLHRKPGKLRRSVEDLVSVVRPGWRFLKGAETWDPFFQKIVSEVPDPRLSNEDAVGLANIYVSDYVWTARKISRGELVAAQRMLHGGLGDINLRLIHECRLREGLRSFEYGRRIERIVSADELAQVTISGGQTQNELARELEKSAATCRDLMKRLLGHAWTWPAGVTL